jgi:hypothetical protein
MQTETFPEACARLKQLYLAYHSTFGSGDATENDGVLVGTVKRLEQKYRKSYEAQLRADLKRMQQVLEHERGIEAFIEVSGSLHGIMPSSLVPIGGLTKNPLACEIAALCRWAFKPSSYTLGPRWLNGRHFVESDFRYHVEYVCGFEDLAQVAREVKGEDRVVDLQVVALGLKELLECLAPDALHRKNARKIRVSTAIRDRLLREVERFLAKLGALPPHLAFELFRPCEL